MKESSLGYENMVKFKFKTPHPEIITAQHTENLLRKWKYINILFLILEIKDVCTNVRGKAMCFELLIIY